MQVTIFVVKKETYSTYFCIETCQVSCVTQMKYYATGESYTLYSEYLLEGCPLFLQGFPLTVSPSTVIRIAKHAQESGKVFTMNLSAPFLCQFFKEPMLKTLPYVDILFGNETVRGTNLF